MQQISWSACQNIKFTIRFTRIINGLCAVVTFRSNMQPRDYRLGLGALPKPTAAMMKDKKHGRPLSASAAEAKEEWNKKAATLLKAQKLAVRKMNCTISHHIVINN